MCPDPRRNEDGELILPENTNEDHVFPMLTVEGITYDLNKDRIVDALKKILGQEKYNVRIFVEAVNDEDETVTEEIDDNDEYKEIVMEHLLTDSVPYQVLAEITDDDGTEIEYSGMTISQEISPQRYCYADDKNWYAPISFSPSDSHTYLYLTTVGTKDGYKEKAIYSNYERIFKNQSTGADGHTCVIRATSKYPDVDEEAESTEIKAPSDLGDFLGMDDEGLFVRLNADVTWTMKNVSDSGELNVNNVDSVMVLSKVFLDPETRP
ncbi:hypothetical protein H4219_001456 [Mycoemilia scoparia]|uniref:Uncharacterized protein n=1 Tax=Mycoemilia scoparia TaxID=417184 RepID=A0A9W8A848_9FUNG|nr:hypothetical protein H4219_001456 [Mycoemilia scoparia]